MGAGERTVREYLREYSEILPALKDYAKYDQARKDLIGALESTAVQSMSKILASRGSELPLRELVYAFQTFHNAGRLERNLSTQNTESRIFTAKFDTPSAPITTPNLQYIADEDANDR